MTVITHPMASFTATILKDTFPSKYLFPIKHPFLFSLRLCFLQEDSWQDSILASACQPSLYIPVPIIQTDILKASSGYFFSGAMQIKTILPSRLSESISSSRKSHLESLDSSFVRSLSNSQFAKETHTFQSETHNLSSITYSGTPQTLYFWYLSHFCV